MLTTLAAGIVVPLLLILWSGKARVRRSPWPAIAVLLWYGFGLVRAAAAQRARTARVGLRLLLAVRASGRRPSKHLRSRRFRPVRLALRDERRVPAGGLERRLSVPAADDRAVLSARLRDFGAGRVGRLVHRRSSLRWPQPHGSWPASSSPPMAGARGCCCSRSLRRCRPRCKPSTTRRPTSSCCCSWRWPYATATLRAEPFGKCSRCG